MSLDKSIQVKWPEPEKYDSIVFEQAKWGGFMVPPSFLGDIVNFGVQRAAAEGAKRILQVARPYALRLRERLVKKYKGQRMVFNYFELIEGVVYQGNTRKDSVQKVPMIVMGIFRDLWHSGDGWYIEMADTERCEVGSNVSFCDVTGHKRRRRGRMYATKRVQTLLRLDTTEFAACGATLERFLAESLLTKRLRAQRVGGKVGGRPGIGETIPSGSLHTLQLTGITRDELKRRESAVKR